MARIVLVALVDSHLEDDGIRVVDSFLVFLVVDKDQVQEADMIEKQVVVVDNHLEPDVVGSMLYLIAAVVVVAVVVGMAVKVVVEHCNLFD